jgi:hypothetical protein
MKGNAAQLPTTEAPWCNTPSHQGRSLSGEECPYGVLCRPGQLVTGHHPSEQEEKQDGATPYQVRGADHGQPAPIAKDVPDKVCIKAPYPFQLA